MTPGFKVLIKRDLDKVFHNANEHADMVDVVYNGRKYNIPVVIDSDGARDRKRMSSKDNADGIFIADMTVYINMRDIGIMPRKETHIVIDNTKYTIVKTGFDAGSITLDLEVYDE